MPDDLLTPSPQPGLGQTLKQVMPIVLAGLAAKQGGSAGAAAMLGGMQQALERRRQMEAEEQDRLDRMAATEDERAWRRQQYAQSVQERATKFVLDAAKDIAGAASPAERAHLTDLYEQAAVRGLGLAPGTIRNLPAAPTPDTTARDAKDAGTLVESLQKQYGEQFWQMLDADVPFKGQLTKIRHLVSLAGGLPTGPNGQPITPTPKPKPEPKATEYDESWHVGQALANAEAQRGRPLTAAERRSIALKARAEFGAAGRAPEKPDTKTSETVDRVALRSAETWRANQLAALEAKRRETYNILTNERAPALDDERYQAELARIDRSYRAMRAQAGVADEAPAQPATPGAALSVPPALRPMTSREGQPAPPARPSGPPTSVPGPAVLRKDVQPGVVVTLRDGSRVRVTAVNPDGSFETEPVR